jgi:GNAT superfamily N-acetyltransferase
VSLPPGARIERVAAEVVRPLRSAVLRAGQPLAASVYPEEHLATTVHLAARSPDGAVVGCATWFAEPPPAGSAVPEADGPHAPVGATRAWRLRGMATDPSVRGQGYGGALLRAGLRVAAEEGAELVWCNARTSALGFYAAHGFQAVGPEFETAGGIPHRVAWRPVGAGGPRP